VGDACPIDRAGSKGEGVASEQREPLVDVHSHFVPALPRFDEVTGDDRWPSVRDTGETRSLIVGGAVQRVIDPTYESVAARVERIERAGVDLQVLSPLPALLPQWADNELAAAWCRKVNAGIAEAVAVGDGRFLGFGILPAQDPELAMEVWSDAAALGLVGVELGTAVDAARLLHDPTVDELLAGLAAADVPALVHPNRRHPLGRVSANLERGLALPTDTALAVGPRIERAPSAPHPRSCLSHGGGTLIWEWGRIFAPRAQGGLATPPWLSVDTAGCRAEHVEFLVQALGEGAVMFGTDQPAVDDHMVRALLDVCDRPWGQAVSRGNAERFLGISLGCAPPRPDHRSLFPAAVDQPAARGTG
jgi:aminocarboxymuconate-semialdehyde decarboxylase